MTFGSCFTRFPFQVGKTIAFLSNTQTVVNHF